MQVRSSYGAEIRKQKIPLQVTLDLYRKAVAWLIRVYEQEWEELAQIREKNRQFNHAEHLVHETRRNRASYPFDRMFPKMPAYLRRSAIRHALGSVASYHTRLSLWEAGNLSGKPRLTDKNHAMPVFYHKEMYRIRRGAGGQDLADSPEDWVEMKLYSGKDWLWYPVRLLHTDLQYLRRHWAGKKTESPVPEKKHMKYFLRFTRQYIENQKNV